MDYLMTIDTDDDCTISIGEVTSRYGIEVLIKDDSLESQALKVIEILRQVVVHKGSEYGKDMEFVVQQAIDHFNLGSYNDLNFFCGGNRTIEILEALPRIEI